jgi:hypothetical protein
MRRERLRQSLVILKLDNEGVDSPLLGNLVSIGRLKPDSLPLQRNRRREA